MHGISIRSSVRGFLALALLAAATVTASNAHAQTNGVSKQTAELYQLQAAFHRALTVHDPVNGDSSDVVTQRIRDMLSLWTDDAKLYLHGFGSIDGFYAGKGDPDNLSTCPEPTGAPGEIRGNLCTYFKYFAGSMQQANKFIVLTPSFITAFDISGDTALAHFQCHFYDVSTSPWTAKVKVNSYSNVKKVEGKWLFSYFEGVPVTVPDLTVY